MLVSPEESLALWSAGGPLPQEVLDWAGSLKKSEILRATSLSITKQRDLLAQCRRDDHQLALEVAITGEEARGRIAITLLNGRKISSSFDLVKNRMGDDLHVSNEDDSKTRGNIELVDSIEASPNSDRTKHLIIDTSEGPSAGDVIVRMPSTGLVGYYTFDQVPTKVIKRDSVVIGEEPYPVIHLWDYLRAKPLSVHIKPFLAVDNFLVPPCFTGSLTGGIPVYAQLSQNLLELYTTIFAHRTKNMGALS